MKPHHQTFLIIAGVFLLIGLLSLAYSGDTEAYSTIYRASYHAEQGEWKEAAAIAGPKYADTMAVLFPEMPKKLAEIEQARKAKLQAVSNAMQNVVIVPGDYAGHTYLYGGPKPTTAKSSLHLYISKQPNRDPALYFVIQYAGRDWLNWGIATIYMDGEAEGFGDLGEPEAGAGAPFEFAQVLATKTIIQRCRQIAASKDARLALIGYRQEVREVTKAEKKALGNVLALYDALMAK